MPLRGAGGEPISFVRTIHSHGCADLAPATVEATPPAYRRTFRLPRGTVDVRLRESRGRLIAETDRSVPAAQARRIVAAIRRMFRLDDDLSAFYRAIGGDPQLSWAANGAGRLLASPTVFEDVVKTICTTNCAWSATVRMTRALAELGSGAFPEPEEIARTPEAWFRDVARMGYRGPYVQTIARDVAAGRLDLESFRPAARKSDETVRESLLALPGIGPYAAAHAMQLLGRHRHLVLDSWTRPAYLRLMKKKRAKDGTIERSFACYGAYAGLVFWLVLTRDWVEERA